MSHSVARCAVVVIAVTLGLSACQNGAESAPGVPSSSPASPTAAASQPPSASPSASRSPSASPTAEQSPAQVARAENVAEAEQRYLEYQKISSEYAKKGQTPFWELMNGAYLGSAEIRESERSYWDRFTDLGLKETGDASIEVVEVTGYEGDPLDKDVTGHRVHMTVCIDSSGADVVRPDGTSTLQEGGATRVLMKVVMQGQPREGVWSVNENTSTGKEC